MNVAEELIEDIRALPAAKLVQLRRALGEIDPESAARRREARARILEETAGVLAGPESDGFEAAIEELGKQGLADG